MKYLIIAVLLMACSSKPSKPQCPNPSKQAHTWTGYGLVNQWHKIDAAKLACLLYSNGHKVTQIEYVPWWPDAVGDYNQGGHHLNTDVNKAKVFVTEMRKRGIATLITVVNWNSDAQRNASDQWFRDRVAEIRDQIGTDNVILEGVSEPSGSKSHSWMSIARQMWPGLLAANGDGGRGTPAVGGYNWIDWHHCSDFTSSTVKSNAYINSTDCGPVINPGPDRARRMTRIALDANSGVLIYDFNGKFIDENVIRAMGEEIQK